MAASADAICSLACELLGHTPFTSFASTSDKLHKAAERSWSEVRDAVLGRHGWRCAVKRVLLTVDVTAPAYGFAQRYALPNDWLRTLTVGDPDNYERLRYQVEGGFILVDWVDDLPLRYVWRQTDVTKYPPHLSDLMVAAMMARMAYPITQSTTKAAEMRDEYEARLTIATALDAAETDGETFGDTPLLAARFRGA